MQSKNPIGELALLSRIRARAAQNSAGVPLGIGDDCALLRPRTGEELAVTTDLSLDGRHFRLDWHAPEVIGHRTLARGLSDLAAMGARPVAAFLSLGLPPGLVQPAQARSTGQTHSTWLDRFYDGFLALAHQHKTPLAGGDLAQSTVAVADIVLIGAVRRGRALLRSGARPGHALYVTGSLGGAAAALAQLARLAASRTSRQAAARQAPARQTPARGDGIHVPAKLAAALEPHLHPQPRIAQGLWLVRHRAATAALDLSDGLSTDLHRLCEESGVAAEVNAAALPVFPGASLDQALNGGEDYELLFTARPTVPIPRTIAGVPVTRIGQILSRRKGRPAVTLLTGQGAQPIEPRGWEHFSDTDEQRDWIAAYEPRP